MPGLAVPGLMVPELAMPAGAGLEPVPVAFGLPTSIPQRSPRPSTSTRHKGLLSPAATPLPARPPQAQACVSEVGARVGQPCPKANTAAWCSGTRLGGLLTQGHVCM